MSFDKARLKSRVKAIVKELAFIALIAGSAWLVMSVIQREQQKGGGGKLPVGQPAPAFALTWVTGAGVDGVPPTEGDGDGDGDGARTQDARGQRVSLESRKGRPMILNFWATWCGSCVSELPEIAQAAADSKGRYSVLTVNNESPAKVRKFLASRGLKIPVVHDPGGRISDRYGVDTIPTTVIIDAQGNVVHDFVGAAHGDILADHMDALVGD